jgi:hypothetical protein
VGTRVDFVCFEDFVNDAHGPDSLAQPHSSRTMKARFGCSFFLAAQPGIWLTRFHFSGYRVYQAVAEIKPKSRRKMQSLYTSRMGKKLRVVLALAVVALVAGGTWFVLRPGRHFDPLLWSDSHTPASVRLRMADDLVSNKKLIGLARQEVVARLGEPPKTEYFKEFDLVYYLGPERGFISIDSEWLLLNLGPDGRVQRATIARG